MLLNQWFTGIFTEGVTTGITLAQFLMSLGAAVGIGLFLALIYTIKTTYTKSFVVTLALIPAVVSVVIMMVNGNIGAGVAVAGAFSLVRFRSIPGTAKEIGAIFLAMGAGLTTGMGYLGHAILFSLILGGLSVLYTVSAFGSSDEKQRVLQIAIPENMNFTEVFDDLFEQYTTEVQLDSVKTIHLGSVFKLTYTIKLKDAAQEKAFIDAIRCRNGNLEITLSKSTSGQVAL